MPDLVQKSTPPHAQPPHLVTPPRIASTAWQDYPVFREAFLIYLEHEPLNSLFRMFGRILYDLILNYYHKWPQWPEGVTATELRAAVGDLRHLQGYLSGVGKEEEEAPLKAWEADLSRLAARQARELARVADEIETALDSLRPQQPEDLSVDPSDLPSLDEMYSLCYALAWEDQAKASQDWLITRWIRGASSNEDGNAAMVRWLRARLALSPDFGFYHTLTLELLSVVRERGGQLAKIQAADLVEKLLSAPGIPANVVAHYRERLA